jgi:outer membrane receptor protein involved in Fe transport
VMVDGIKANAFGGGYDFSTLSANQVERIEVVRGPESALFGADAIGAVVHVVTKHTGRPRVEGLVEGGSFGTSRITAGTWGSRGPWSWGGSAERTASDGYTGIAPATGEVVANDDFLSDNVGFSAGWRGAGGADVRGSLRYVSGDRGYPGPYGSNPIGAYTAVDRISRGVTSSIQAGGRWTQPFSVGGHALHQTVSANYLDLSSDFTSAYGLSASEPRDDPFADRRRSDRLAGAVGRHRGPARAGDEHVHHCGPDRAVAYSSLGGGPLCGGALSAAVAAHADGRPAHRAPGARRDAGQLRLLLAAAGAA